MKDTPQQFLNALYVAAGDDLYYDGLTVHEAALTAAGNNSTAVNAEYDNWDAWVSQVEKQYPVWAENFTSGTRQTNAQQAIQTLTQIFKDNAAPKDEQSTSSKLLVQYQTAAAAYQQAGTQSDYYSAQAKVSDSWIAYVDSVALARPAAQAHHSVRVQERPQGADLMPLTDSQLEILFKPLNPIRVAKLEGKFSYLETWDVLAHLSRIFGPTGWDKEVSYEVIYETERERNRGTWRTRPSAG